VEFQYNNKRHIAISRTSFKLNFERHPWKGNLVMQIEFPKLEAFLKDLQRSWEKATKSMETAQETIKKQFDKKQRNLQELNAGDNMWLEKQEYPFKQTLKEAGLEKIWTF